jgi:predicted small secreted protein
MMRRWIAFALAAGVALVAGCNTMQGLGKDIERGGEKLQDKAKR